MECKYKSKLANEVLVVGKDARGFPLEIQTFIPNEATDIRSEISKRKEWIAEFNPTLDSFDVVSLY